MRAAVAGYLTFAVVLLGGWELTARLALVDADLLPPLSEVCVILWGFLHDPRFMADLGLTGGEVAVAFVIGAPGSAGFLGHTEHLQRRLRSRFTARSIQTAITGSRSTSASLAI